MSFLLSKQNMASHEEILKKFIEQNEAKIDFYDKDKKYASNYAPHLNPVTHLSSFAKRRESKNGWELARSIVEALSIKTPSKQKHEAAKNIVQQLLSLSEEEKKAIQSEQKIKEQKEKDEEIRKEKEIKTKETTREKAKEITKKPEIKKETTEILFANDHKSNLVISWLETEKHMNLVTDALLQDDEIMTALLWPEILNHIKEFSIDQKTYTEQEKRAMTNIQQRCRKKINEETQTNIMDQEEIIWNIELKKNELMIDYDEGETKITVQAQTRSEIKNQNEKIARDVIKNFWLRSRVFDRIIEYIEMDIIKAKVHPYFKEYILKKTNATDDTYAGVDFMLLFTDKNNETKIAFIDALISNQEKKIEAKQEAAKKETIPYNAYITYLETKTKKQKENQRDIMKPVKKYAEILEPNITYFIISNSLQKIEQGKEYHQIIKKIFQKDLRSEEYSKLKNFCQTKNNINIKKAIDIGKYISANQIESISIS